MACQLVQWCVSVATSNRAIKRSCWVRLSMVYHCGNVQQSHQALRDDRSLAIQRKPSVAEPWSEPWNILPGTGAAGAFHAKRGHSRSWNIFSGAGVKVTPNFASLASIPGMRIWSRSPSNVLEVESKSPGHLIRAQSPIRSEYFHGL